MPSQLAITAGATAAKLAKVKKTEIKTKDPNGNADRRAEKTEWKNFQNKGLKTISPEALSDYQKLSNALKLKARQAGGCGEGIHMLQIFCWFARCLYPKRLLHA